MVKRGNKLGYPDGFILPMHSRTMRIGNQKS